MNEEETRDYFSDATNWSSDQEIRQQRAIKIAWTFAAIVGVIAILEAIIILALLPLKTVEPVMLLVDRTTGFVQKVDPSDTSAIRADEALTQSLLAQYVMARERYDRATVKSDYQRTALWSSGKARQSYLSEMSAANSVSPQNRYRSGESLVVEVKSVSKIDRTSAFVRFDTFVVDRSGARSEPESWISLVSYRFSDAAMSYEDRLLNPLGLQVSQYRRDAERPNAPASIDRLPAQARIEIGPAPSSNTERDAVMVNEGE